MNESHRAVILGKILNALKDRKIISKKDNPRAELALVPNSKLRAWKKKFLNKEQDTVDVLSFPAEDQDKFPNPENSKNYLGEIYVNESIAKKNPERGIFLVIHGILHLLGYRHEAKRDTILMEKLEHDLLKELISNF